MYLSRSIPYWHHPIQLAVSLWTWRTYKDLSHSVMRLRHLRSLVSCRCYTTARSHSHLQDGPGLKDFIVSSGVQSPATGSAEGGARVPYLRDEDIAGQGRKGSFVPLSPTWRQMFSSTLVVILAFASCLGAECSCILIPRLLTAVRGLVHLRVDLIVHGNQDGGECKIAQRPELSV